jgi:hypothetical protein
VHSGAVLEILQRVFDPFQDLLPRGSGGTISGFQFFDLRLEAAMPPVRRAPSEVPVGS